MVMEYGKRILLRYCFYGGKTHSRGTLSVISKYTHYVFFCICSCYNGGFHLFQRCKYFCALSCMHLLLYRQLNTLNFKVFRTNLHY